jgi:beta-mannosidase
VFEGLDTYADVFLNGERVLTANNMHREWRIDVSGRLKATGNHLFVSFRAAVFEDMKRDDSMKKWRLPANYSFSRKSAY